MQWTNQATTPKIETNATHAMVASGHELQPIGPSDDRDHAEV